MVAIAAKNARMAWAVLKYGEDFRLNRAQPEPPKNASAKKGDWKGSSMPPDAARESPVHCKR